MVQALAPTSASLAEQFADVVEQVIQTAVESEIGVAEAVERCMRFVHISPSDIERLARVGLGAVVGQELHRRRQGTSSAERPEEAPSRSGRFRPPAAIYADSPLWQVIYEGADGFQKPFAKFGIPDCDFLIGRAKASISGWKRVAKRARRASDLMRQHGVSVVWELPEDAFRSLEEEE